MVKIKKHVEVTQTEALALIRKYIAKLPPPKAPEFAVGDAVRLDTGALGVVSGYDPEEGSTYVCYIDDDGAVRGPSYGWVLTKIEEN